MDRSSLYIGKETLLTKDEQVGFDDFQKRIHYYLNRKKLNVIFILL